MKAPRSSGHEGLLELVEQALTRPPDERDAWLTEHAAPETLIAARRFLDLAQTANRVTDGAAQPTLPVPALEGRQIGVFRIEHLLGAGGMGQVYRAVRVEGGFAQTVAIKVVRAGGLNSAIARQFMIERQVLANLRHPNIAALLDSGTTSDGLHFVVMEFVEGVTLDNYLRDNTLSVRAIVELFLKVCRAVQLAHQALIIHRDIKPHNILVTADGEPKLLDFGIAKALQANGMSDAGHTLLGALTPAYASPEQLRGESLTTASDVFALGIVLYQALTGETPYDVAAPSTAALERALERKRVIAPSVRVRGGRRRARQLRGDLDAVVLRALAPEVSRRYGDAQALADELERFLNGQPVAAQQDSNGYRLRKLMARNKTATVALTGTACAVVLGLASSLWQISVANAQRDHAREQLRRAEAVSGFLGDILLSPSANWDSALQTGANATISDVLNAAEKRLPEALPDLPDVRIRLLTKISEARVWMHQTDQAQALMRDAVATADRELPADAPLRVEVRYHLGDALLGAWEYAAAITIFEEALQVGAAHDSMDDLTWIYIVDGKALAHSQLGEFAQALALQTQAVARWHELYGDEPMPAWAEGYGNKAYYEYLVGDLAAARTSLARADIAIEQFPELTTAMGAEVLGLKGMISYLQRRDAEALAWYRAAVDAARVLFAADVDKEEYAYAASSLAMRLCDRGALVEAAGYLDEIDAALGDYLNYADGWLYHEARAWCAVAAGEHRTALRHAATSQRLGTAQIMAPGATGQRERTVALAHAGLGEREPARAAAQRSVAAYRQWLGADHPMTLHVQRELDDAITAGTP